MGYWVLLALSGFFTLFSAKWSVSIPYRYASSFVAFLTGILWFATLAYHTTNPPSTFTVGDFVHQTVLLVYLGLSVVMLIAGVMAYRDTRREGRESRPIGRMELGEDGYRQLGRERKSARNSRRRI